MEPNDHIKIINGPWKGTRGLFIKRIKNNLYSVKLEFYGLQEVNPNDVEKDDSEPLKK